VQTGGFFISAEGAFVDHKSHSLIDSTWRPHLLAWLLLTLLVNALPLFTPILNEGDSVLYAALSQHMVLSGNWNDLMLDGRDWLDKPHFPFWLGALSFKLFGVSVFAYMLPGYLFHLLGGYFTYRIARLFHGRDTALMAALVYASTYHLMYTTTALKAEAFLTGSIMAACYYWLRFDADSRLKYVLLGALFSGISVMTKGVFTLVTITSGLVCCWAYQGRWRELFRLKWLAALVLTGLCVMPEVWALYRQFDMHPDKTIFNQTGVSGIRFFLWDSQFGRFFNVGPITNTGGNKLFFVLAFLWAFLPWVAAFVWACWRAARPVGEVDVNSRTQQVYLLASFTVSFVMFSLTSFQLDYYTVIVYPFATVLIAPWLLSVINDSSAKAVRRVQISMAMLALMLALWVVVRVGHPALWTLAIAVVSGASAYVWFQRNRWHGVGVWVLPVIAVNFMYLALEGMTLIAHTRFSIPHNVLSAMAHEPVVPVVVYQLDPPVSYELGLYRQTAPVLRVEKSDDLPMTNEAYFLLTRTSVADTLAERFVSMDLVTSGDWVDHKTGTLPRQIELAAGRAPLENFSVYKVTPR
jgi:4-amino-4-deoxy-L-arabinose transferase-like glycosyltransferase